MSRLAGRNKVSQTTPEYGKLDFIDISSADYEWGGGGNNAWFKVVTTEDCYLNAVLDEMDDPGTAVANLAALGGQYFPFKAGEGSNARVKKIYHDAGNVIGGYMWAVR